LEKWVKVEEKLCVIGKQQGIAWSTRKAEKGGKKKLLQEGLPRKF
jgi:hypothetical protein